MPIDADPPPAASHPIDGAAMILPFRPDEPRPYVVIRTTFNVDGLNLRHITEWWDAATCTDPHAWAMPHRDDIMLVTRLLDPVSGRIYHPAVFAPAAASH